MSIDLELQIASKAKTLPHPAQFREWITVILNERFTTAEITIRIVDEEEIRDLNKQYRNKDKATNVLSFPYEPYPGIATRLLGDILICAPVVEQEAKTMNKPLLDHWAHMVVHGTLHLLGYDHEEDIDANVMENLETEIMVKLGFSPPYGDIERS